jgi:hypothetical protein
MATLVLSQKYKVGSNFGNQSMYFTTLIEEKRKMNSNGKEKNI